MPTITPITSTTQTIPQSADGSSCYRMTYNPATKKIMFFGYGNMRTMANTPLVVLGATTYAEIAAEVVALGLSMQSGKPFPGQVEGQP